MKECETQDCKERDGHFFEPVFDEYFEKEFKIEGWHYYRKKIKKKIYKKHMCSFCGLTIRLDDNDGSSDKTESGLFIDGVRQ